MHPPEGSTSLNTERAFNLQNLISQQLQICKHSRASGSFHIIIRFFRFERTIIYNAEVF